ncbi:MAG: hypothetical protein ABW005_02430 [Burkholderiaceae bacterium]
MATTTVKSRIENLIATAQLLERVDADPSSIGAAQYQRLTRKVQALLSDEVPADAMQAVLRNFPATALLYENMHYDQAGLSQAPLELAVSAELQTRQLLEKLRPGPHKA